VPKCGGDAGRGRWKLPLTLARGQPSNFIVHCSSRVVVPPLPAYVPITHIGRARPPLCERSFGLQPLLRPLGSGFYPGTGWCQRPRRRSRRSPLAGLSHHASTLLQERCAAGSSCKVLQQSLEELEACTLDYALSVPH